MHKISKRERERERERERDYTTRAAEEAAVAAAHLNQSPESSSSSHVLHRQRHQSQVSPPSTKMGEREPVGETLSGREKELREGREQSNRKREELV